MPYKNTSKTRKRFQNKSKSKRKTKKVRSKLKQRARIKDDKLRWHEPPFICYEYITRNEDGTRVRRMFDLCCPLHEHMMDVFEFEFIKITGESIIILRDVRYLFFSQWEEFMQTTLLHLQEAFNIDNDYHESWMFVESNSGTEVKLFQGNLVGEIWHLILKYGKKLQLQVFAHRNPVGNRGVLIPGETELKRGCGWENNNIMKYMGWSSVGDYDDKSEMLLLHEYKDGHLYGKIWSPPNPFVTQEWCYADIKERVFRDERGVMCGGWI